MILWAASVMLPGASWAADDLITSQMVDEARSWQSKGRSDLAGNVWRRILVTHPDHVESLANLGLQAAKAGNWPEARALYQRAKRQNKSNPTLNRLESLLKQQPEESVADHNSRGSTKSDLPPAVQAAENQRQRVPASNDSDRKASSVESKPVATNTREAKITVKKAPVQVPLEPVAPPSIEVRVTPLPLAGIADARMSALTPDESTFAPKPSDNLRLGNAAGAQPPAASANISANRRPKPCRIPLASTTPPGAN